MNSGMLTPCFLVCFTAASVKNVFLLLVISRCLSYRPNFLQRPGKSKLQSAEGEAEV